MSDAPPPYHDYEIVPPPSYSESTEEGLTAQLEQMKAMIETMRLEKDSMMWNTHLQKEAMMEKMRLEKEAMMEKMRLEKEAMMEKMRQEKHRFDMEMKRVTQENAARVEREKRMEKEKQKEFLAQEKHWSSDFDSWDKNNSNHQGANFSPSVRSIVSAFLKTIPHETLYAIHSITLHEYQNGMSQCPPAQYSQMQMYIATNSKVYMMSMYGDIYGNYNFGYPGCGVFKEIVTFPSEPTPTFWRAVFSQMGHEDTVFTTNGDPKIYTLANAKLEALFRSFR